MNPPIRMSTNRWVLIAAVEIGWVALVAAVLLIGDYSHPFITEMPTMVRVNAPLIVSFDRPVDHASVEKGFSLRRDGVSVPGKFSWSSQLFAYIPEAPLAYGSSYDLELADVHATDGGILRTPYRSVVRTPDARFFYVAPDFSLHMYDVTARAERAFPEMSGTVLAYDVSEDGQLALVSTESQKPPAQHLYVLRASNQGEWKVFPAEEGSARFTGLHVCANGQFAVAYRASFSAAGTIDHEDLVSFDLPVDETAPIAPTPLVDPGKFLGGDILTCARSSDSVLYRDGQNNLVLLPRGSGTSGFIGKFPTVYGFSPRGGSVLFEHQTDPSVPTNRLIYSIDQGGGLHVLSDPLFDAMNPSEDPQETLIAVADIPSSVDATFNPYAPYGIHILSIDGHRTNQIISPSGILTDNSPAFSQDGQLLTYVQYDESAHGAYTREGFRLDGAIWLVRLKRDSTVALDNPDEISYTNEMLPIHGGMVEWLP
jgi:hypothetical protein